MNGKSKDHYHAQLDLQDMKIKPDLYPINKDGVIWIPVASYILSKSEKKLFCKRLFDLKLPDGYSSNISNCVFVDQSKIMGLKSHDCHILMQ